MDIQKEAEQHQITRFIGNIAGKHGTTGLCKLHYTKGGRLVITGGQIDLFDLLLWVEQNPLAQFRVLKAPVDEPFEPSDTFKHLFDNGGNVL